MLLSLFRFLFFECPTAILTGLILILFEEKEIVGLELQYKRCRSRKEQRRKIINDYLSNCFKQVNKD